MNWYREISLFVPLSLREGGAKRGLSVLTHETREKRERDMHFEKRAKMRRVVKLSARGRCKKKRRCVDMGGARFGRGERRDARWWGKKKREP